MALNDFYRTSIIFNHPNADGDVVNVVDFELLNIGTIVSEEEFCEELAQQVVTIVEAELLPALTDSWTLNQVTCFNITQPQFQGNDVSGSAGAIDNESVAIRSAPVATKRTGLRGRSFNGRMFLPSIPETNQDAGVMNAGLLAVLNTYVEELRNFSTTVNTNEYIMVVFSQLLLNGTRVTSLSVRSTLGSIRGRQRVS